MSTYPSTIASITDPQASDKLNSPSHSALHQNENDEIEQTQRFLGTTSSAIGTIVYDVRSSNSDGGGHIQSANKGGTGQTSFNKGDMLVATSSSVISKLGVGSDGQTLTADSTAAAGVKWAAPGVAVTSLFSSGVWTKPAGTVASSRVFVELWGGGGSGGAASGTNEAGGGGGGAYISAWYSASILSGSVLVGVGAGGVGVGTGNAGLEGGFTVFDTVTSLLTATRGGAGGFGGSGAGGGGGGGNEFSGTAAAAANGGGGGSILGGNGGNTGNGGVSGKMMGSAGGGGGGGGDGADGGVGNMGGGGGGGAKSGVVGAGGVSLGGGNGGAGSIITGSMVAAAVPSGGGGAAIGSGAMSGAGGAGKAIITTFL